MTYNNISKVTAVGYSKSLEETTPFREKWLVLRGGFVYKAKRGGRRSGA